VPRPMNDDEGDVPSYAKHGLSHLDMDEAFCSRMRAAIAAGLESAPDGVIAAPGTKNPKYVPTNTGVVRFSPRSDDF
jgi:hypothetical protein